MARIIALGTAAAVPAEAHGNTYLAVEGKDGYLLIDCAGSPLLRLERAGLALDRWQGLIITHFHPDQVKRLPYPEFFFPYC